MTIQRSKPVVGGGWKAVLSVLRYAAKIGPVALLQTLTSKNACKACAFGTGGQNGGLFNESRNGIEVCNKNIQAHLSDIRAAIPAHFFMQTSIDELSRFTGKQLEDIGRLTLPLYKKDGEQHYTPIRYEQALDLLLARLQATDPQRSFFYASGRSSNEAAFVLQLLARLYGTNNINNCSYYCHQASGVGLTETLGTGTATVRYQDLEKADTIFVFGANPASNHPRFVKTLFQCRRRGGEVIVVNPAIEPGMVRFASPSDWKSMVKGGEAIASLYVQPHLGGDLGFMLGVGKWLLENKAVDNTFIERFTEGYEAFSAGLARLDWQQLEQSSGVSLETIEQVASRYANAKNVVFAWSMGLTHHGHGVGNIETLVALALMRGMVGRPGAGLLPLRGHSNIQGMGSMGFTPALKAAVESRLQEKVAGRLPQAPGLDTMACMEASARGEMDLAFLLGGNLLASNPDASFATGALDKIGFKCLINPTLNASHVRGVSGEVLILPVRVRDEETEWTTQESMFNFVRLSEGGINRFPQLRSEISLIQELGERLIDKKLFDFSLFRSHQKVREFIGETVPGFTDMQKIDTDKAEFHIGGRTLHSPAFNTESGLAKFVLHPLPVVRNPGIWRNAAGNHEFRLTSVRSEGQFNSIIFDERDTYREQSERWVVMMNPDDMALCGYTPGCRVNISTPTGSMSGVKVQPFAVRAGNIMVYYPEANILIPRAVDARSKTPSFKCVTVEVSEVLST